MEIIISQPYIKKLTFYWDGTNSPSSNILIRLTVPGAGVHISGIFRGEKNNNVSLVIGIRHEASSTQSRVVLRGLLCDRATADVKITAVLQKGARGADAAIDAKALLLSEDAKAQLMPYLEIDEQEVKATHRTFVGPLEEEELFYTRSRGVNEQEAKKLLIDGFLAPVLSSPYV